MAYNNLNHVNIKQNAAEAEAEAASKTQHSNKTLTVSAWQAKCLFELKGKKKKH